MAYQPIGGQVSTVNSSTVNLAAAGVFTGTAEDISQYSSVTVFVNTSHASSTDGLSIEFSVNGTTWPSKDVYTIPATTGKTFGVQIPTKFFRVVYTNGATATTTFELQTIYHSVMPVSSSVRPQDGRGNDNDFQENLAYGMVYNVGANTWDRQRGLGGAGMVALTPSPLAVTVTAAANTLTTLSLPAAGAGLFHYITSIEIAKYATVAVVGAAAPVVVTSTNLPGALAWTTPTAQAVGTQYDIDVAMNSPLKSSTANTTTTIVGPATASVIWRITAFYYTGV